MFEHLIIPSDLDQKILSSTPVEDPFFTHTNLALFDAEQISGQNEKNWIASYVDVTKLEFLRPKDIFKNYTFLDSIFTSQINQGSNGNCYMLVVLAALSI